MRSGSARVAILAAYHQSALAVAAAITGALANAKVGVETKPVPDVWAQEVRTLLRVHA